MHARRTRPDTGPIDRRRLAAAGLSAVIPGLGQLANGRRRLAWLFLIPSLILLALGAFVWLSGSPTRLAATLVSPGIIGTLLTLNVLILVWRLLASGQAFLDTRRAGPSGRLGLIGVVILAGLIILPHAAVQWYGSSLASTFGRIFQDTAGPGAQPTAPPLRERITVLLIGTDKTRLRTTTLTDTMIVASLDPVAGTVSMLSVPRDLVQVPLGSGDEFGPKLNSLMSYADAHPEEFPDGGLEALKQAVGTLLGIDIPYYAEVRFGGFIRMVDAVGGVDVTVIDAVDDPTYDGYGLKDQRGFSIDEGEHHLDGISALAYARARKGAGESDFTRAARQQQVILALRDAVTRDGSLFWTLPDVIDAVGESVRTDVPPAFFPPLAAVVDEVADDAVVRAVIRHPLVRSKNTEYGSSLIPDVEAIQAVAARLFPEPGEAPVPWPTPKPTKAPKPSATPEP